MDVFLLVLTLYIPTLFVLYEFLKIRIFEFQIDSIITVKIYLHYRLSKYLFYDILTVVNHYEQSSKINQIQSYIFTDSILRTIMPSVSMKPRPSF